MLETSPCSGYCFHENSCAEAVLPLAFDDDIKAKFGAGDDLTIHHDDSSNTSFITESGSGPLHIRGNNVVLKSQTDNDDFVKCIENGAVEIYYSNSCL